ncbi:DUF6520 family protein [Chitinophaga niabensis]|uniref:NVEALA protein n=1 Tax=Chitinophaga niabensis TaxID=536979 RepID=A0A1N6KAM8_9BACT|nr:DUF6520 family protein [Chitinophaga niabensis]SIO53608.1 hypothetical protein SAMN04488055_5446 [Chitinophaga niabensis]
MKKKLFLAGTAFMLAIGGAFATQLLPPNGYSKLVDVPNQGVPCKIRSIECTGGNFVCNATFQEGGITYNNIPLYDLTATDVCVELLSQPLP